MKETLMPEMRIRRRSYRKVVFWGILMFFMVASFTFLVSRFKMNENTEAANLAKFDPGYIISDWQMGNYTSMTEAEIQKFLTSKNSCANTDYNYYLRLSAGSSYKWHFKDGHFVCLSEELFGDGEVIGSGETAAHIIWQTAQDYKINPQVLLVLLQKETSLITDPIPNNGDYRKATGYGCPDSAPCSSQYYGFKNQVRKAAALFRTVLDGGWTNYPLGENYVQYNPDPDCGGTVVNIRSLATSALYRYTPYQPNASALAAGKGYGDYCSAYGNRNFYHYFEDWFSGITQTKIVMSVYDNMKVARYMWVPKGARYVDPTTNEVQIRNFGSFEFFTHLSKADDKLCLSLGDKKNCYLYEDLEEVTAKNFEKMATARMLVVKNDTKFFDTKTAKGGEEVKAGSKFIFGKKTSVNGQLCLQVEGSKITTECILYVNLEEIPQVEYSNMTIPRIFYVPAKTEAINTVTGIAKVTAGGEKIFIKRKTFWFGELCLESEDNQCILYDNLKEINTMAFSDMAVARFLRVKKDTVYYDAEIGIEGDTVKAGVVFFFTAKNSLSGELCLRDMGSRTTMNCLMYSSLEEVENFEKMAVPRQIAVKAEAVYYDLASRKESERMVEAERMYFVDKIIVDGRLCLRTKEDANENNYRCIMYANLSE